MNKEPTIQNFLDFEKRYKCNEIKVENIPIWSLYRYEIHNAIKKKSAGGNVEKPDTTSNKKDIFLMLKNALRPFPKGQRDILFVCDARRAKNPDTGCFENIFLMKYQKSIIV